MSGSRMGRMAKQVSVSAKKFIVPFGKIASGDGLKVHIKNVADSEAREIRVIGPFGVSSCPLPDTFAQIIFNDHINNTCPGIYDDKKPKAKPGEVILYNKENKAQVKLAEDNDIKAWNDKVSLELKPDGTIVMKNDGGSVSISTDGSITFKNSNATITASSGGTITMINGGSSISLSSGGGVNIRGSAINITGDSFTVNSSGAVNINGSAINLN